MGDYSELAALYGELGESPIEEATWRTGVFDATRVLECDWLDRTAVYNTLITTEYPHIPGTGARALGGDFRGWGESSDAGSGKIAYEKARVRLYYTNRIEFIGGKWLTEQLAPSSEFRQLDARSFRWDNNDGTPVRYNEAPAMRQVFLDYLITFHKVLSLPAAILTHQGACNDEKFASYTLGLVFDPETMVLVASPARRTLYPGFLRAWELTYHFRITPHGANTFWRPETLAWEPIYHEKGADRYIQHPLMDFALLVP